MADADVLLQQALEFHHAGKFEEADEIYRRVLENNPEHPDALNLHGAVKFHNHEYTAAIELIEHAIRINPETPFYYNNCAMAYDAVGNYDKAIAYYEKALSLRKHYVVARNNLANTLAKAGQIELAMQHYNNILLWNSSNAEACLGLGNMWLSLGARIKAVKSYKRALANRREFPEAYNGLGAAYYQQGKLDLAEHYILRALKIRETFPEAYLNLATVCEERNDMAQAVEYYRKALQLKPDYEKAAIQLAFVLQRMCVWPDAWQTAHDLRQQFNRDGRLDISPFRFLTLADTTSAAEQHRCAQIRAANLVKKIHDVPTFEFERKQKDKIRIGYVSSDLRGHAVGRLIVAMLENHDHEAFEVYVYTTDNTPSEGVNARIIAASDEYINISNVSYKDAANRIYMDGIDILVDLNGYTKNARTEIFACKPAPVQINYLGYPGTMGAEFMDYLIADKFLIPDSQQECYSEKVIYLPGSYQPNDPQRTMSKEPLSREQYGLPEDGFVFCCFNNNYKITEEIFTVWMHVLHKIPQSVLWLLEDNQWVRDNLHTFMREHDVDPQRLIFAPRQPVEIHLARQQLADLFLDTLPYNAHTTASDALWCGLPLLTCVGDTFPSRVAGSLLTTCGLQELITYNLEEYEARAIDLATHPERLDHIRQKLQESRDENPLFNMRAFARRLEQGYSEAWELFQQGEAAHNLVIDKPQD